jgi:hypothetical protein
MDGVDVVADLDDFAGNIAAGNVGKRNGNAGQTVAHPEIEMIEGAGANADEDFVGVEVRFGNIGVMEHTGVAMLVKDNRFHKDPPEDSVERDNRPTYGTGYVGGVDRVPSRKRYAGGGSV